MWTASFWPDDYWTRSYWPHVGTTNFTPPTGTSNQYLPLLGVGAWLIGMVLAQHLTALISSLPR